MRDENTPFRLGCLAGGEPLLKARAAEEGGQRIIDCEPANQKRVDERHTGLGTRGRPRGARAVLKCPHCDCTLAKAAREGGIVIVGKYLRLHGGRRYTKCPQCGKEVQLGDATGAVPAPPR